MAGNVLKQIIFNWIIKHAFADTAQVLTFQPPIYTGK